MGKQGVGYYYKVGRVDKERTKPRLPRCVFFMKKKKVFLVEKNQSSKESCYENCLSQPLLGIGNKRKKKKKKSLMKEFRPHEGLGLAFTFFVYAIQEHSRDQFIKLTLV